MGLGTHHLGQGTVCSGVSTAATPRHPTKDLVPWDVGCDLCGGEEGLSHPSFPNTLGGLAAPAKWLRESCGSTAAAVPKPAFPILQSQP